MSRNDYRIMVISDIHLLAPELYDDGAAAQRMAAGDMKLSLKSDTIMQHIVDRAIADKPDLLLITGDLTLNGARASHERLVGHLARLQQNGVPTLVIPGNHDISCPNARRYVGSKATQVPTITRDEFAQLYAHHGYGNESLRDPASLSYVCDWASTPTVTRRTGCAAAATRPMSITMPAGSSPRPCDGSVSAPPRRRLRASVSWP